MTDDESLPKISASFRLLATEAEALNVASDTLGQSIAEVDSALKTLNLGIDAWVLVDEWAEENGDWGRRELGYAKVGHSKWGISLRDREGNEYSAVVSKDEQWLFNDAPRALRIRAVDKLPGLLEKLIEKVEDTRRQISEKIADARKVTAAVKAAAPPPPDKRPSAGPRRK
jgi:hypothetical protein